jgi:hypothetical protein
MRSDVNRDQEKLQISRDPGVFVLGLSTKNAGRLMVQLNWGVAAVFTWLNLEMDSFSLDNINLRAQSAGGRWERTSNEFIQIGCPAGARRR